MPARRHPAVERHAEETPETHDRAPNRFRIRPTWLSLARDVEGAEVNRRFTEPSSSVMLPFTSLPYGMEENDRDILELFLRAADEAGLQAGACCEGCVQNRREELDLVGAAAALTLTGLPSSRRHRKVTTPFVLLTAIAEPVNQARRYFKGLDPFLHVSPLPHETRQIAIDAATVIGKHVRRVVGQLEDLVAPGNFMRRSEAWPQFARPWNLDDYEDPFSSAARLPSSVRNTRGHPELFPTSD